MMRWIVGSSLKFPLLVVAVAAATMVVGFTRLRDMPVDVLPEFGRPTVEVETEALGLSAADVEQLITVPMEQDLLNGVAFLDDIRSESVPGLSRILLVFKPGTDLFVARQVVAERLTQAHALPNVSKPPRLLQPLFRRIRALGLVAGLAAVCLSAAACGATAKRGAQRNGKPLPGIKEFGFNDEQFAAHIERTQSLIAKCMAAAGFEYIPVDVKTVEAAQARVRKDPGYTRRTYKERWGLGITTRFDDPVRDIGMGPNLRIYNSLPKADKVAYSRTLWGEDPKADFVFTFDEEDFSSTGGCTRQAVAKVFAPAQLKGTYVNPKDVLVDSDPRIVAARKKWSQCMRGHGYEYKGDQDEIIEDYEDAFDELTQGDDPRSLTGGRLKALHRLQAAEIKVSLADLDCQLRFTDAVERKVEIEVYGQPVSG